MATTDPSRTRVRVDDRRGDRAGGETKPFFLTSEFLTLVAGVVAILIAALIADNFEAPRAWLYATILGAAYMVSRGLAKSGSRDRPRDLG
jgi:hypothetical protein